MDEEEKEVMKKSLDPDQAFEDWRDEEWEKNNLQAGGKSMNPVNYVFKELLAHFVAPRSVLQYQKEIRDQMEDVGQGHKFDRDEIIYYEEGGEIN